MIPCEECLVFSLCKSRVHSSGEGTNDDERPIRTYGIVKMAEKENCLRLAEYVLNHSHSPEVAVNEVREVFNLRPVIYSGVGPATNILKRIIKDGNKL